MKKFFTKIKNFFLGTKKVVSGVFSSIDGLFKKVNNAIDCGDVSKAKAYISTIIGELESIKSLLPSKASSKIDAVISKLEVASKYEKVKDIASVVNEVMPIILAVKALI